MMKRVFLLIVLIAIACSCLSALTEDEELELAIENKTLTADELLALAIERSTLIAELSESRYNSFVDNILTALTGPNWNVGLNGAEFSLTDNMSGRAYQLPGLDVSYTSPTTDDGLAFDARVSLGSIRFESENDFKAGGFGITFHGGISKEYQFHSWDDTDYSRGWSDTLNRIQYENTILQFEIDVLTDLRDLLILHQESVEPIMTAGAYSNRYRTDLENGVFTEDSPEGIRRLTEWEVANAAARQKTDAIKDKTADICEKYGLEPEEVMLLYGAEKYELEITPIKDGNYEVHSKYLEVQSLKQQIAGKTGTSSSLTLRAGLDPKITFADALQHESNGITADISASYTTGNFSFDLSVSSGYSYNLLESTHNWNGPTISVSGTWSNTPQVLSNAEIARLKALYTTDNVLNREAYEKVLRDISNNAIKAEILEINRLEDELAAATREWNEALTRYNVLVNEFKTEIRNFNNEYELALIKYEGEKRISDKVYEMVLAGEMSAADFLEADTARTEATIDLMIRNINSHIIYNRIQMLQK